MSSSRDEPRPLVRARAAGGESRSRPRRRRARTGLGCSTRRHRLGRAAAPQGRPSGARSNTPGGARKNAGEREFVTNGRARDFPGARGLQRQGAKLKSVALPLSGGCSFTGAFAFEQVALAWRSGAALKTPLQAGGWGVLPDDINGAEISRT